MCMDISKFHLSHIVIESDISEVNSISTQLNINSHTDT